MRTARRRACAAFTCALPEHLRELTTPHVAHPGCFATATLLASVPLLALEPDDAGAVRRGGHRQHRLGPQARSRAPIIRCATAISTPTTRSRIGMRPRSPPARWRPPASSAQFAFVPHSGPVRARHSCHGAGARCARRATARSVLGALREFYADAPFVHVGDAPPRVKDVASSNYARLSAVSDGRTVAVMCAIDNLNKGAAGGAVQWMNRLYGLPETAGLTAPAPGWT